MTRSLSLDWRNGKETFRSSMHSLVGWLKTHKEVDLRGLSPWIPPLRESQPFSAVGEDARDRTEYLDHRTAIGFTASSGQEAAPTWRNSVAIDKGYRGSPAVR